MKEEMIWLDRYGWPLEHLIGHPILNWFRDRIHGVRKVNKRQWLKESMPIPDLHTQCLGERQ